MKYQNIAIILTFFSLWLSVSFVHKSQDYIAFFLIFSFGILHGSNDLALISKISSASKTVRLAFFMASYVVTVIVASLFFYYIPIVALLFFVLFSGFHFGEQHWNDSLLKEHSLKRLLFITYGISLLFLLFYLNVEATQAVIFSLTKLTLPKNYILYTFIVSSALWMAHAIMLVYRKILSLQQLIFEVFMVLVFAIVFKTATLLWAFAIYFIFWHSIPSILEQQSFLYGEITMQSFARYVKSSFFIWLISIVSIGLLFVWIADYTILLPVLFAFLGAITFAHSFTISRMFTLKK